MESAQGIHDHPTRKLGLIPHSVPDHRLLEIRWKAGVAPTHPVKVDNMAGVTAGLDKNDQEGDCGPTSIDNHRRITTYFEGAQVDATQPEVDGLYTASTNPPFDPKTGANDNGVMNPDLMKALQKVGLGGDKIVAYGRLADITDASINAAIYTFKAVIWAVDLQVAQQDQSDANPPYWDYKKSAVWGGHDIVAGAYDETTGETDVFSWAMRVKTTALFRQHQLTEVWVPIWPQILTDPKFLEHVDLATMAASFKVLTGADFPAAPSPQPPAPTPTPTPPAPVPTPASELTLTINDAAVISHINSAAAKAKEDADAYATKHFRSYFKIKD